MRSISNKKNVIKKNEQVCFTSAKGKLWIKRKERGWKTTLAEGNKRSFQEEWLEEYLSVDLYNKSNKETENSDSESDSDEIFNNEGNENDLPDNSIDSDKEKPVDQLPANNGVYLLV